MGLIPFSTSESSRAAHPPTPDPAVSFRLRILAGSPQISEATRPSPVVVRHSSNLPLFLPAPCFLVSFRIRRLLHVRPVRSVLAGCRPFRESRAIPSPAQATSVSTQLLASRLAYQSYRFWAKTPSLSSAPTSTIYSTSSI